MVDNQSDIFATGYQISSGGGMEQPLHLTHQISHVIPRTSVLVVEQNPSIQDMLCWALELAGYHAIARAPNQIVKLWNEHQQLSIEEIALLLLDLSFPWERDGVNFLRLLRAHWATRLNATLPIIVLTTSEQIYQELTEQGELVEKKPFHLDQLLARIHTLLIHSRPEDMRAL